MIVCRAEKLTRHYGPEPVFMELDFQIQSGDRIGLVGPNGAGKTTLIRLLEGRDAPDGGKLHFHPDAKVAVLTQFVENSPTETLLEAAHGAMRHLEVWHEEMVDAGRRMAAETDPQARQRWSKRYDEMQERLRQHGGYDFSHRIEEVLGGLAFQPPDFDRLLATFSGGERNRVQLARLLLTSPDLMLLDEPTNHLDIETTEWLEGYLSRQTAAMVIVSHDRYFLDRTANRILELHAGRLTGFSGNYSAYAAQRAERAKTQARVATKQREALEHHEDFVARNKYGQLARQAKSREKMIARIEEELVETTTELRGPPMSFAEATRTGDVVIRATGLGKSFTKPLFAHVSFEIERGERVGIVGRNGSGKTTLLRILLGQESADSGSVKLGQNVRVGYLDQELRTLDPDQTPIEAVRPEWRIAEKDEPFRAILARFGMGADLAEQRIRSLSGGERTRVALARLLAHEANVLVLDEPTNHLDLWARESLEAATKVFEGTLLVVSHDRYFLNQVVQRILVVGDGQVRAIPGNYARYQELREQEARQAAAARAPAERKVKDAPGQSKRKRKYPFRKTADLEADIARHEADLARERARLAEPEVYRDGRKSRELVARIESLELELAALLEHWEEAMELNPPTG